MTISTLVDPDLLVPHILFLLLNVAPTVEVPTIVLPVLLDTTELDPLIVKELDPETVLSMMDLKLLTPVTNVDSKTLNLVKLVKPMDSILILISLVNPSLPTTVKYTPDLLMIVPNVIPNITEPVPPLVLRSPPPDVKLTRKELMSVPLVPLEITYKMKRTVSLVPPPSPPMVNVDYLMEKPVPKNPLPPPNLSQEEMIMMIMMTAITEMMILPES